MLKTVRLGTFAWDLSLGNIRKGFTALEFYLEISHLRPFAWDLSLENFAWDLSLRHFRVVFDWKLCLAT